MDGAMCTRWWRVALIAGLLGLIQPSSSRGDIPDPRPCPDDADHAAAALLSIKAELNDPNDALRDWKADGPCPCPCNWKAVACFYITYDGGFVLHFHVAQLHLASLGLSGTLSPRIGNLTTLQMVHLQGNNISGPIPDSIGSLRMLWELDMSNNSLNGSIPSSLGNLKRLHYLKLNNNSLSGVIPDSLGTIDYLEILDLSFNNLSGPLANISAGHFNVTGNPLVCGVNCEENSCSGDQNARPHHFQRVAVICAATVGSVVLVTLVGMILWWRYTRTKKILPVAT